MNNINFAIHHHRNDYQLDNFLSFLKDIKFSYNVPSIHVAGTNGKGSTCFFLSNIYQCSSYKVGLFMSPYFYQINEMISINGEYINDETIKSIICEYQNKIDKFELTEFEIMTFVCLKYFNDNHCDIGVIECGMGGENDATNVFDAVLSIITSVSLEHTSFLGKSLYEIAEQKAGIISNNSACLIGKLPKEADETITYISKGKKAICYRVDDIFNVRHDNDGSTFSYQLLTDLHIKSSALYSCNDAAIALEATQILKDSFPVTNSSIYKALNETSIPCRLEIISKHPLIVIDGAHNPEAADMLIKSFEVFSGVPVHIIFASFRDKNINLILPSLSTLTNDIILTTFNHPRARNEDEYFLYLEEYKFEEDYKKSINEVISNYPNDLLLITGSLAFVSLVRKEFFDGKIM